MKKMYTIEEFARDLLACDRGFSVGGAYALAEAIEEMEDDLGEDIVVCPLDYAISFFEIETIEELLDTAGIDDDDVIDLSASYGVEPFDEASRRDWFLKLELERETSDLYDALAGLARENMWVVEFDGGFLTEGC